MLVLQFGDGARGVYYTATTRCGQGMEQGGGTEQEAAREGGPGDEALYLSAPYTVTARCGWAGRGGPARAGGKEGGAGVREGKGRLGSAAKWGRSTRFVSALHRDNQVRGWGWGSVGGDMRWGGADLGVSAPYTVTTRCGGDGVGGG